MLPFNEQTRKLSKFFGKNIQRMKSLFVNIEVSIFQFDFVTGFVDLFLVGNQCTTFADI